jgi:two-component system, NarL family, invasion response regulator UvrY
MAPTAPPASRESDDATVHVLVVDDQRSFRAAAAAVIELTNHFLLAGEAEGASEAEAVLGTEPVDLVLMDINLRDESGIDVTAALLHDHPGLRVILMSTYADTDLPPGAATCGAMRYVHKERLSPAALIEAWNERDLEGAP